MRVVVVDDDVFKRSGIAERLRSIPLIDVVDATDQDEAARRPLDSWDSVDIVVVDVCDDLAIGEVGTDVYSGIEVVDRVRRIRDLRCIAVTPTCAHPLVQLRLQHAGPDFAYHRFELNSTEQLASAIRAPGSESRLPALADAEIRTLGGHTFSPNRLVAAFVASPLHGHLRADSSHKSLKALGIPRSAIDAYCSQVDASGFSYAETLSPSRRDGRKYVAPRWPVVRDLTLRLLGRLDAPPTEFDRPWWGSAW